MKSTAGRESAEMLAAAGEAGSSQGNKSKRRKAAFPENSTTQSQEARNDENAPKFQPTIGAQNELRPKEQCAASRPSRLSSFRHISELTEPGREARMLRSGGELVSRLTKLANIFIFSYSVRHKSLISWSDNIREIFGTRDLALVRDANLFLRHVHADDRFKVLSELEQSLRGEKAFNLTYRWIRPDTNELRWLLCRAELMQEASNGGQVEMLFEGIIFDVTEELQNASGKLAAHNSGTTILFSLSDLAVTLDQDLRLMQTNSLSPSFGADRLSLDAVGFGGVSAGQPLLDAVRDESQKQFLGTAFNRVLLGEISHFQARLQSLRPRSAEAVEILVTPIHEQHSIRGLLCLFRNLREVVKTEQRLFDLQKTEGLRLLSAGVNHHFNNALQSIIGQAIAINAHPENKELIKQASASIIDVVNKTSELSHQLAKLENRQQENLTNLDLNLALMTAISQINDAFTFNFKIAIAFGNLSPIRARQRDLIDAIVAILRSIKEVLSGSDPLPASIALSTFEVDTSDLPVSVPPKRSYAKIKVSSLNKTEGSLPIQNLFFKALASAGTVDGSDFSTSETTELDMKRALGTLSDFGAEFRINNANNSSDCVEIYFPTQSETQTSEPGFGTIEELANLHPQLMIIDDDPMILKTMTSMISDLGYACLSAEDYKQAMKLLKDHSATLKLIFIDALMPGMDGPSLLRKLRAEQPSIRVLGFTGAPTGVSNALLEAGAVRILHKPVDQKTLLEVLRQELGEPEYTLQSKL